MNRHIDLTSLGLGCKTPETLLIYCLFDGGRGSRSTDLKVNRLLRRVKEKEPTQDAFVTLHSWWDEGTLPEVLKDLGLPNVDPYGETLSDLLRLNLNRCTENDIHGVRGLVGAKFFIKHSKI